MCLKHHGPFFCRTYLLFLSFSRSVLSDSLGPHELQHTRLPCPSPSAGVFSNSRPLSQWYHPTISSSVVHSCFFPRSLPASGSFPMSQLFASGSQSIRASASASVLPMSTQGWFPLGLTGLTSLQSKGLSRVFCSTTVRKFQFFGPQSSLWSNSHLHKWLHSSNVNLMAPYMVLMWVLDWKPLKSVEQLCKLQNIVYNLWIFVVVVVSWWSCEELVPLKVGPKGIFHHLPEDCTDWGELKLTQFVFLPSSQGG